jgi:autotransporter-associated beta strand protein
LDASTTSTIAGSLDLTLSGAIDGTGNLIKDGSSTLTLSGPGTYNGTTTVSAGTLLVNGSITSDTTVNGGVLGGEGGIDGSVTVNGGTLSPGASIESLATGALAFNDGSTFLYDLDSSVLNGDLLVANGALDINATSTLTFNELPTGALSVGSKLTLVNYSGAWNSGTFAGYANNSTFVLGTNTWQIKYDDTSGGPNFSSEQGALGFDNYLTITVVPEPSTFAMLLFGSLLWWTVGKKRRP